MRRLLVALIASVSSIAFTQIASAADLPTKAPALVAPIASGWTGWYIGGELGAKSVSDNWNTTCVQLGGPFTCGSALNSVVFPGAPDSTASNRFNTTGVRYGLYLGAMYQVNPTWVVGLEGDYGFYNQSSS